MKIFTMATGGEGQQRPKKDTPKEAPKPKKK